MKKVLLFLLAFVLSLPYSAGAIYFVETQPIIEESIGLPDTYESEMSFMANGETFEQKIISGWKDFSERIDIEKFNLKYSEVKKEYDKVFYNNPLFYYVGRRYGLSYRDLNGNENADDNEPVVALVPTYTTTNQEEINQTIKDIEKEADNILLYVDKDMTEFEKVMAVHDYMVLHYDYDHTLENHSITIMTTKKGVCESYAFAFIYMMDLLGIEATYVSSEVMEHAWNLVKIDDKWYHIDLTWDDTENPDQVGHSFELLSDKKIQSMENPHYGYDTGGLKADSEAYDNASWHENSSQIVSVRGVDYWVSGNALVDENGNIIHKNLDEGDGSWDIGDKNYYLPGIYAGVAEFGGKLYYNTDSAIYQYNPKDKKKVIISNIKGVCGLYIDGNILKYNKAKIEEKQDTQTNEVYATYYFYEAGEIKINGVRISVPYIKNGKAYAKIYNDGSQNVNVFSFGKKGIEKVNPKTGVQSLEFDTDSFSYIYFLDDKLCPLGEKVKITK